MTAKTLTIFLLILAFGMSTILPAFAALMAGPACSNCNSTIENNPATILINTDLPTYNQGDTIQISGQVNTNSPYSVVTLKVISPNNNLVLMSQLIPSSEGQFSKSIEVKGSYWQISGNYTITAQYGSDVSTQTFHYNGGDGSSTITKVLNGTYPLQAAGQIYNIPYIIKGGTVSSMNINAQQYTLEITSNIDADGSITVAIPRSLMDAKTTNADVNFIVTVEGQVTQFTETTNSVYRILSIPLHNGDTKIDISGTQVGSSSIPQSNNPNPTCSDCNQTSTIPPSTQQPRSLVPKGLDYPGIKQDWTIKVENYTFTVTTTSNYDLKDVNFDKNNKGLIFTGNSIHTGNIIEMEIPHNLLRGNLIAMQNGQQILARMTDNPNYSSMVLRFNQTGSIIMSVVETNLPESPSNLSSVQPVTSVFTLTPQDIENINQAKTNQTIAAEVNVEVNQSETRSIDNNVSVQTTQNTPDTLGVQVSANNQTGPKVIVFNLAATTINVQNLKDLGVMYDGKLIAPAPNMDAILHAKPTDSPSFAIVVTQSGVQVLVLVPHFSTHTITITNMSKVIPVVPEFGSLAVVIITISLIGSIVISRRFSN